MRKLIAAWAMLVAAFFGEVAALADSPGSLAGTAWGLGKGVERNAPFIEFDSEGRASGALGCNRFSGAYKQSGNRLRIGALMSTRMMCGPDAMDMEHRMTKALSETRRVSATARKLELRGRGGRLLMVLERR